MEPLTSATASPSPSEPAVYRPISALAVAALLVGTLTALLLIGFGISAAVTHRPFISPFMMLLAITSLGLAIAAKMQLSRSQGTRAGGSLANFSLFLSLITSLGYMAYWFAIDLSVRQQSYAIAEKWLDDLEKNKPELAFRLTRDPGQQKSIPEDADAIRRRFGNVDLSLFTRSDIPRLFRTWPDQYEVSFDGVHNWEATGTGLQAELNFSLRFPEGVYPIIITTLGSDDPDTGSRVWQVNFHATGLKKNEQRLTILGKMIYELQFKSVRELQPSYDRFREGGAEKVESLIRLDGAVPPPDKRKQLAADSFSRRMSTSIRRSNDGASFADREDLRPGRLRLERRGSARDFDRSRGRRRRQRNTGTADQAGRTCQRNAAISGTELEARTNRCHARPRPAEVPCRIRTYRIEHSAQHSASDSPAWPGRADLGRSRQITSIAGGWLQSFEAMAELVFLRQQITVVVRPRRDLDRHALDDSEPVSGQPDFLLWIVR